VFNIGCRLYGMRVKQDSFLRSPNSIKISVGLKLYFVHFRIKIKRNCSKSHTITNVKDVLTKQLLVGNRLNQINEKNILNYILEKFISWCKKIRITKPKNYHLQLRLSWVHNVLLISCNARSSCCCHSFLWIPGYNNINNSMNNRNNE